jgi:hypothetical protein
MAYLGKAAMVGQVWLTAIMTLIAGMPHFSCLCPDGAVKPLCVSLTADSSGCCCAGGKCCAHSRHSETGCCKATKPVEAGRSTAKSCCAAKQNHKPAEQSAPRFQAERKCCVKTPAQPPITAVSYYKTVIERDVSFAPLLPQSAALSTSWRAGAHGPAAWQINLTAPPTDLVDLLQRYLI